MILRSTIKQVLFSDPETDELSKRYHSSKKIPQTGHIIYAGLGDVSSGSKHHVSHIKKLYSSLTSALPKIIDREYNLTLGNHSQREFTRLFSLPGRSPKLPPQPQLNNIGILTNQGINPDDVGQLNFGFLAYAELLKYALSKTPPEPRPFYVKKDSSNGFPYFEKGDAKREAILSLSVEDYLLRFSTDYNRRAEHALWNVFVLGKRSNAPDKLVDGKPKARFTRDQHSDRHVFEGKTVESLEIDLATEIPGFYAPRSRIVYSSNGRMAVIDGVLLEPLRYALLNTSESYKHRDDAYASAWHNDMEERDMNVYATDISSFDTVQRNWTMLKIFDIWSEMIGLNITEYFAEYLYSPLVIRSDRVNGKAGRVIFDLKSFHGFENGIPSGVTFVSAIGTALNLVNYFQAMKNIDPTYTVDDVVNGFEGSSAKFNFSCQSDDIKFALSKENDINDLMKNLPCVRAELEDGVKFKGLVCSRVDGVVKCAPDASNFVVNFLSKEKSATSNQRMFEHTSFLSREERFKDSPDFEAIRDIWYDSIQRDFAIEPEDAFGPDRSSINFDLTGNITKYLLNPDIVFYDSQAEQIRAEVIAAGLEQFASVPVSTITNVYSRLNAWQRNF